LVVLERLVVIAAITVASDLTYIETGSARMRISGSFLGIILAAVLLGGGPAAVVGVLAIAVGWFRSREAPHYFRNNLVTYAWFPLLAGLWFQAVVHVTHAGTDAASYYLLVFLAFVLALALNFLGIAGYQCWLDGVSIRRKAEESLMPILASELVSAPLLVASVYLAVKLHTIGLALFGLVVVAFQYLVSTLLLSKRRAEDLERMATTDELTGLPNRECFRTRLQEQIDAVERDGGAFAVMLMDLDRFKEVNDTLGHVAGDQLLRQLGPRLAKCVAGGGLVARLGGDEFAILTKLGDSEAYAQIAGRLLTLAQEPLEVDELSLEIGASVGIALWVEGTDADELLRRADVAMYDAKEAQTGVALYTPEHDKNSKRKLELVSDVRRAIEAGEVIVHYQPQVCLEDMAVHGVEALVRWQHPTFGLLPPSSFIDIVEQTALIGPLTHHVLDRSIAQCAEWRRSGRDLYVAVNLALRNVLNQNLPAEIERMLDEHGLSPDALQVELTENMLMSDPDRALATLRRVADLGVRISVDDFGIGQTSLAKLTTFPIDELKIDQLFVTPMLREETNLKIVRSTVNLAHDLGLKVIAEGVEDGATLERLSRLGCDLAQGFHLSRPLSSEALDSRLGPKLKLLTSGSPARSPVRSHLRDVVGQ
jgi:diguanylate cyclase (GGDEF)-like protein